MLLLSGISREDSELEVLQAVLEGHSFMRMKALAQLPIDSYPGVTLSFLVDLETVRNERSILLLSN
jgi:hypothetical protein